MLENSYDPTIDQGSAGGNHRGTARNGARSAGAKGGARDGADHHASNTASTRNSASTRDNAPRKRATILDIAKEAGVSRQTVSRAMNDQAEISEETKRKVLEAADKLGYRPNRFASNMARQRDIAIGLAISSLRNPFYTDLVAELDAEFAARGWQVIVVTEENSPTLPLIQRLAQQADAVVGYFSTRDESALHQAARGLPLVIFDFHATLPGVCSIGPDFDAGMATLFEGLRHRGAQRFGMLDAFPATGNYSPTPRRELFEKYLGDAPVALGFDTMIGGATALEELLRHDPSIDTVIAFNDMMAIGAIQKAKELGLSIPENLRIAGIDGLDIGAALNPSLTTLAIDRPAIARHAAMWLEKQIMHPGQPEPHNVRLVSTPVWRTSA